MVLSDITEIRIPVFTCSEMAQSPQNILDELAKGILRPLYFLQGEEPYYIDRIIDYLEENALEPSERGFNQLIIYGKDTTMGNVIVQARRFPMMAQRQLVLVKEAQEIGDLNRKEGQELLEKYAANPVPSTILVFGYKYKKLDGRKSLSGVLDKKAILVNSDKFPDYKLNDWITSHLKSVGIPSSSSAVQMLADHIGNDLSRIANELEKVKLSLGPGTELTKEIIHQKIGISKEFNGFEFQNALASRNLAKALQIAEYFVANPKSTSLIQITALLFTYFTKVLQTHVHSNMADKDLASLLGVNPFFVKDYKIAKSRFTTQQILHILHQIRLADGYAKGIDAGDREEISIYQDLILQIVKC